MILYTLGHSAHPIGHLIDLLKMHGIRQLIDVRSTPASRFHPQFNKANLERALTETGIAYVYMGTELGGRPNDPGCFKDPAKYLEGGKKQAEVDFERVMERDWFQQGIEALLAAAEKGISVILCSEEDPDNCHRKRLIAEYLRRIEAPVEIHHIRKDGSLEGEPVK